MFSFLVKGPRGLTGTTGAQGDQGDAGAQGEQGIQGIQGVPGNYNYVDRGDPASIDKNMNDFTKDGTWRDLDLSSIVPAGAVSVHINVAIQSNLIGGRAFFRQHGNSNDINTSGVRCGTGGRAVISTFFVSCDVDRHIDYFIDTATWTTVNFVVCGWIIAV